ncbi:MAG: L-threonylcarbamoyladenylate synthase [Elusimicrobiota bacterium]
MKTKIIKVDRRHLKKEDLRLVVEAVREGKNLVFPTDTVYGLGANAFNPQAIKNIYKIKGRSFNKPLILFIPRSEQLTPLISDPAWEVQNLINQFWPGPLTIIFKASPMAQMVTGRSSVAVRIPDDKVVLQILNELDVPLATTSANRSGHPSPLTFSSASKELSGKVDLIIDAGKTKLGKESTIIDASSFPFCILREGCLTKGEIFRALQC